MIYHLSFDLGQKNAYVSATILEKNTEGNDRRKVMAIAHM
jgi:hypothetical protein